MLTSVSFDSQASVPRSRFCRPPGRGTSSFLVGSLDNNLIIGNDGSNLIDGSYGKDTLTGRGGPDHFHMVVDQRDRPV